MALSGDELLRLESLTHRAVLEKTLGPVRPVTSDSLANLALNHCRQGEYDRAEPPFTRAAFREHGRARWPAASPPGARAG